MTEAPSGPIDPDDGSNATGDDYDPDQDQDTGSTNTAPPGERPSDTDSDR